MAFLTTVGTFRGFALGTMANAPHRMHTVRDLPLSRGDMSVPMHHFKCRSRATTNLLWGAEGGPSGLRMVREGGLRKSAPKSKRQFCLFLPYADGWKKN